MSNADWLFSLADIQAVLPPAAAPMRYAVATGRGTMSLGLYAPRGPDMQTPHDQDELYVIVAGAGNFSRNGESRAFAIHDVIFVEAGVEHRFEDLSEDFAAWVIFWGPKGGDAP
jgi:mannose-6-phosphate isomerase-like protein (cupin superfamily)